MITLVTGDLHAGKTTKLAALVGGIPGIRGFLCRAVFEEGQRIGYDLVSVSTELEHQWRTPFMRLANDWSLEQYGPVAYELGKYVFLKNAFDRAEAEVESAINAAISADCADDTLAIVPDAIVPVAMVIEELGFLEMKGGGFAPLIGKALENNCDVYSAVRSSSLDAVCRACGIDKNSSDVRIIEVD